MAGQDSGWNIHQEENARTIARELRDKAASAYNKVASVIKDIGDKGVAATGTAPQSGVADAIDKRNKAIKDAAGN